VQSNSILETKKYPTLSKTPILVAILEIVFKSDESVKIESLRPLKGIFKQDFPNQLENKLTELQLRPDLDKTFLSLKDKGTNGFVFASETKKRDFTISTVSYNFKQHGKYSTWEEFKREALDIWIKCIPIVCPKTVSRISIRYLNSIEIDSNNELVKAEKLFNTYIVNSGGGSQKPISNYFVRYTNPELEDNITVHFAQELKIGASGSLPFIIDIDVLFNNEMEYDYEKLSKILDQLRIIKNDYFFDNLTDFTLDLIK